MIETSSWRRTVCTAPVSRRQASTCTTERDGRAQRRTGLGDHPIILTRRAVRGTWETQDVDPSTPFAGPFRRLEHAGHDVFQRGGRPPRAPPPQRSSSPWRVALVKFLGRAVHRIRRRGAEAFAAVSGSSGHGNVAGNGQALPQAELEEPDTLP